MIEHFLSQLPPFELNLFWGSQLLIGFAFISDAVSWQFKKREWVLVFLTISCCLIAVHYLLLGEYAGAVLIYLSALRYLLSIFTVEKIWKWIFLVLVFIGSYFTYQSSTDFIVIIANIIFNFAAFQEKDKDLRKQVMLGCLFIIAYNFIIFSPAAIVLEIFFLLSNMVGYWRFYLRKK